MSTSPPTVTPISASDVHGQVDVAILTIREDEFHAVESRLPEDGRGLVTGRQIYQYGVVPAHPRPMKVAVVRAVHQGQGHAQRVTADIVADLLPRWLLLVGIAGGTPDSEYTLGDVHLCTYLHDFSVSAALQERAPEFQVTGGRMHAKVERLLGPIGSLLRRCAPEWNDEASVRCARPIESVPRSSRSGKFYGPREWQRKVRDSLSRHFLADEPRSRPLVKVGPTISSNTLVKDAELLAQWRNSARAATHVEMELGGAYLAARTQDVDGCDVEVPVLAIRGLSDIVGYKRDPAWTEYACHSAAALTFALIRNRLFDLAEPENVKSGRMAAVQPTLRAAEPVASRSDGHERNPFAGVSAITESARLIGREDALRRLSRLLSGGSVAVVGAPKIGKSSLLHALARQWPQQSPGRVVGPIDLQGLEDVEHFYSEVATALGERAQSWRPLSRALRHAQVLLLLDNIDSGPSCGVDVEVMMRLRSVCNGNRDFKMVCVSRQPLRAIFPDEQRGSPVFNIFSPLKVAALDADAARALLDHPWMPGAPALRPDDIAEILTLAGSHPFLLQRAAFHCFEAMIDPAHDWRAAWHLEREHML